MRALNNKILILVFAVSLFVCNVSFSQIENLGIKGGLNLSNAELEYSFNQQFENKTGFNVYVLYDFLNYKNVIISAEAGYSQKGFNDEVFIIDEFGNQLGLFTLYNRLNYIDINAIAEFILRRNSVSPYFSFGPVLSIYTGDNVTASEPYDTISFQELTDPLFKNLKSPVLGFIAGAGIEINKVIPQTIITEIRYNFDLTNSYRNENLNYQRNYLWQFNLGIKF